MNSFMERVESLLRTKSVNELKTFILKIAAKTQEETRQEFLALLNNKCIIISKNKDKDFYKETVSERIVYLFNNLEKYEIEAHWHESYEWDDGYGGYKIENDSGFADEFYFCYAGALNLLGYGFYKEAVGAFDMLFKTIEKFDKCHENDDEGELPFETFINEGLLKIDLNNMKALKGYSALMDAAGNSDRILADIFDMISGKWGTFMFSDIMYAGNEPIPNIDGVLDGWIALLYEKPPETASAYIKEAAGLSNDIGIMEKFVGTCGSAEPNAYIDLCELYTEIGSAKLEKIITTAENGLKVTGVKTKNRDKLADLLSSAAKKSGNIDIYKYAIIERFYSKPCLENYLPVLETAEPELIQSAVTYLVANCAPSGKSFAESDIDYYIIHFINKEYDLVFDLIKTDDKSLGWTGSLKDVMIPLFIGLLASFDEHALIIPKIIEEKIPGTDAALFYTLMRENMGAVTEAQRSTWYEKCYREVSGRTEAIVSGQHRRSYYKAAQLLVAMCEIKAYRNEDEPFRLLQLYTAKYPRHTAFRGELRTVLTEAKLKGAGI